MFQSNLTVGESTLDLVWRLKRSLRSCVICINDIHSSQPGRQGSGISSALQT